MLVCLSSISICIVILLWSPNSRNESAAASRSRFFMWGCHPTEPSVVPQDGAGSESHAATESGPTANPTPGAKPWGTPQLPVQHWPQWMASTCQHLHQQQVKQINKSPSSMWECRTRSLTQLSFFQRVPPAVPVPVLHTAKWRNVHWQQQHEPGSHDQQRQQHEPALRTNELHDTHEYRAGKR